MAFITAKNPGFISVVAQRIAKQFMLVAQSIEQKRAYWKTVRELSELTDYELSDLGISRSDIRAIAQQSS